MSESLYEITTQMQNAFDELWVDEDLTVHGMEALEEVTARFEVKVEAVALYIKNLLAEADQIEQEEDALYERRKRKEAKAVRLKAYLAECLLAAGREQFETPKCDLRFRKSKQVVVSEFHKIPEEFIKEDIKKSADKKAIKKYIEGGGIVPGAALIENQNLQIK